MDSYLSYRNTVTTTVDAFDFSERIKPSAILEYFQNFATAHAELLGIGFEAMKEKHFCWVLNRLSALIEKSPALGETITVTTMPHKPGMVDAVRDYLVTDAHGNCLIKGTSRWCVLDSQTMAVRRCAPLFSFSDDAYVSDFTLPNGNPQLPEWEEIAEETSGAFDGRVLLTDLDRNVHMNNARYADAVLNCCDFDYYATHTVRAFDFNFLAQMRAGDAYTVRRKDVGTESFFEMTSPKSPRPIFRARLEWAK